MAVFTKIKGGKVSYTIPEFDGGLNNAMSPQLVAENESPDLLNVTFDALGAVQTRLGSVQYNSSAIATASIDGIFTTHWSSGNSTMVVWCNGSGYTVNPTVSAIASAASVYTAGNYVEGTQFYNFAIFSNGGSYPYKYDGTNFTQLGVSAPTATAVASINAGGGSLNGTYYYKYTYVNTAGFEGNVSPITNAITCTTAASLRLTGLPATFSASQGINSKWIYRTVASGATAGPFYYVGEATAAATSYTDTVADANLGDEAPSDNGFPPTFSKAVVLQDRLFVNDPTNPQTVFYTETLNPFIFPTLNYFTIGHGDGEPIVDLQVLGNILVVFKTKSVWYLYTESNEPAGWQLVRLPGNVGGTSFGGSVCTPDGVLFLGQENGNISGFSMLTTKGFLGAGFGNVKSESISEKIDPEIADIRYSYRHLIRSGIFNSRAFFAVPNGITATSNNRIIVFDYNRRPPSGYGVFVPWSGMNATCFSNYGSDFYFGSSDATGLVHQMEVSERYNDNGSAYHSYWTSKIIRGPKNMETNWKDFRKYYIWVANTTTGGKLYFSYWPLGQTSSSSPDEIDTSPGGTSWDAFVWDLDVWDGDATDKQSSDSFSGKLSSYGVQFKLDNQPVCASATSYVADNYFKVYRVDFDFNLLQPR